MEAENGSLEDHIVCLCTFLGWTFQQKRSSLMCQVQKTWVLIHSPLSKVIHLAHLLKFFVSACSPLDAVVAMEKRDSHFCHTKKKVKLTQLKFNVSWSHPNKFYIRSHLCSQNRPSRFVVLPGCLTVSPGKKKKTIKGTCFSVEQRQGYRVTNAKNYNPIECS